MSRPVRGVSSLNRSKQVIGSILGILAVALAISSVGTSLSTGIDTDTAAAQAGNLEQGASCHSGTPDPGVEAVLLGVPGNYSAPVELGGEYEVRTYNLTIRIAGDSMPEMVDDPQNFGGFNLAVTGGTLEAVDAFVQITESGEATHTAAGNDLREWNVTWTTPEDPTDAVMFRLTVNAVNGDGVPGPEDKWNRARIVSEGTSGGAFAGGATVGGIHIEELGVNWLAYWVGIASFVFMIGLMVIYYFVFRYAETSHVTDHRARKEKNK